MERGTHSQIAAEGWPWLVAVGIIGAALASFQSTWFIPPTLTLLTLLILLFRDPKRKVPSEPLAVLAPCDGTVTDVRIVPHCDLPGHWQRITIRPNPLGAYTVRAPVEGRMEDPLSRIKSDSFGQRNGLWLVTDEGHDVVLMYPKARGMFRPRCVVGYGERLGQGQRFAYQRLARRAEVWISRDARVEVAAGDEVQAGTDVIARLN